MIYGLYRLWMKSGNIVVFGLPSEVRPVRIEMSNSNSFPFVLAIAGSHSYFAFRVQRPDVTLHVFVFSAVGRWWAVGRVL